MSDESPFIFGDAAAAELERYPRRKWRLGRKKESPPPLTHCQNCGTALIGPYCSACGQAAVDYRRSFGSLLADAADTFFNFDARFLQSFGLLLSKPWRLTNEFIEGKRARHVHPLRVYLIASVIFFLVINYLSRDTHMEAVTAEDHPALTSPTTPVAGKSSSQPAASAAPTTSASPARHSSFNFAFSSPPPGVKRPRIEISPSKGGNDTAFDSWIERRAREKLGPTGNRGDLFIKTVIHNLAPMVLCCIPLFALVLKILYFFKRRYYIEHLIFALHTHAFVFLSAVIIIGLGFLLALKSAALTAIFCPLLSCVVVGLLLVAIRQVYRQNWFATVFKFLFGSVIYAFLLSMAFGVTAVITLVLP